jgi:hypothetical protein
MKNNKFWIKEYVSYCPPCGQEDFWTERVEGEKPKEKEKRREVFTEMCYACQRNMFG